MKMIILTFSLLLSGLVQAKCKLDLGKFYFQGLIGEKTINDDRTKMITIYPKYDSIGSEYEPEMKLYVSLVEKCELKSNTEASIEVYRMVGKSSFKGGEDNHKAHDKANEGGWDKKPYLSFKRKVEYLDGQIMIPNIPIKKIIDEKVGDDEHIWKFKIVIRNIFSPSPNVIIVDHPLIH